MKRMKKLASLLLALVMTLAMAMPVFAAANDHTITITNPKEGHTYTAYQVFRGDLSTVDGSKVLSNVEWGSGITDTAGLLKALQDDATVGSIFAGDKTAADVAESMKGLDDAKMDKISEIIGVYAVGTGVSSGEPSGSEGKYVYTIDVKEDGYYFVKDTGTIANGDAATRYILEVVADVTVAAKADAPSVDKETVGETLQDKLICKDTSADHKHTVACFNAEDIKDKFNNGAIGDTVPYKVTSNIPAMDGYEKYYFVVEDTLGTGLTFNNDIEVKIAGQKVELCTEITHNHTYSDTDKGTYHVNITGQKIEIVFENFIQYKGQTGAIEITYTATINKDAEIGIVGNKNAVKLIYSNNPNTTDNGKEGEPDYPDPEKPQGETPERETFTYVTALQLEKVDENQAALAGAEFKITATPFNKILVAATEYVARDGSEDESAGAIYYELTDGKFTTEAPVFNKDDSTLDTSKYYANLNEDKTAVTKTYKLVTTEKEEVTVGETKKYKAFVNAAGILRIEGLSAGQYVIHEVTAPNGYNILDEDITIELKWTKPANGSICTWEAKRGEGKFKEYADKAFSFKVENKKGSLLPSTGGIGTTIFYVVGTILVLAAGILLVTKRRMKAQ